MARSQPLFSSPGEAARGPLVKGDCFVRDTADPAWVHVTCRVSGQESSGFAAADTVVRSLAGLQQVAHRPAMRPLFSPANNKRAPRPEDVVAHKSLRDDALLAVAQSIAAANPRRLHAAFDMREHGVRLRCYPPGRGREQHIGLGEQLLCSKDGKPLAAGRDAAWPAFVEKAFAATHDGYASLMTPQRPAAVFEWLLGAPAGRVAPILPGWVDDIAAAFADGDAVVLERDDAMFAVVGVKYEADGHALKLANPRGGAGVFQSAPTFVVTDKKPAGKWRGYTRTYLGSA